MSQVRTVVINTQPTGAISTVVINRGPTGPAGITQVTSTTAPTDTSVIWIDPESSVQSIYSGGGWVTQYTVTIADNVVFFDNQIVLFAGEQLTFT